MLSNKQSKEENKDDKIKVIVAIIGTISAILVAVINLIPYFNELQEKRKQEINNLHSLARDYFEKGDYERLAGVYSNKRLRRNSDALLNVGVMYAIGIYYRVDEQQAVHYFERALEMGETYYSIQYILQFLDSHEDIDRIVELVKIGCRNNNRYCEKLLQDVYSDIDETCDGSYLLDFNNKSDKDQKRVLDALFEFIGQEKWNVATGYEYTIYTDVNGETKISAEVTDIEERSIDLFVRRYFGSVEIKMIFPD